MYITNMNVVEQHVLSIFARFIPDDENASANYQRLREWVNVCWIPQYIIAHTDLSYNRTASIQMRRLGDDGFDVREYAMDTRSWHKAREGIAKLVGEKSFGTGGTHPTETTAHSLGTSPIHVIMAKDVQAASLITQGFPVGVAVLRSNWLDEFVPHTLESLARYNREYNHPCQDVSVHMAKLMMGVILTYSDKMTWTGTSPQSLMGLINVQVQRYAASARVRKPAKPTAKAGAPYVPVSDSAVNTPTPSNVPAYLSIALTYADKVTQDLTVLHATPQNTNPENKERQYVIQVTDTGMRLFLQVHGHRFVVVTREDDMLLVGKWSPYSEVEITGTFLCMPHHNVSDEFIRAIGHMLKAGFLTDQMEKGFLPRPIAGRDNWTNI